ncbi:MAG: cytochrome c6 [Acidobacteriota bacterium]|jgi:mono/diheme cytochrome c family protein|nr:cytochrome c6 [Acidobacteriota bacterium]
MKRVLVLLAVVTIAAGTLPVFADAAAVYKGKCAMCHGPDGGGQTPTGKTMKVRDLRSPEVQKMSDADLTKVISDGKGKMPAYKAKLSAAEITDLVKFVRSLKK